MDFSLGKSDDNAAQHASRLGVGVACGVAVGRRKIGNSDSQGRVGPWCFWRETCRALVSIQPHDPAPGMPCMSYEWICLCDRRLISGQLPLTNHILVPGLACGWDSWLSLVPEHICLESVIRSYLSGGGGGHRLV